MWECVGGSVLKGESSLNGAIREAKEEVGIHLVADNGRMVYSKIRKVINGQKFNNIMDVWLFEYNGSVSLESAATDEVAQITWLNIEQIKELYDSKKLVQTLGCFFTEVID